jgi:PAS domain S-box-containing protein
MSMAKVRAALKSGKTKAKTSGAQESTRAALQAQMDGESILNSLDHHVAVLGSDGTILATNDAWNRFATENGVGPTSAAGPGANYLEVCRQAAAQGAPEAQPALDGIQSVMRGAPGSFHLEYPCHSPAEERWFLMTVAPLKGTKGGVVVTHANITKRKRAEKELQQSAATIRSLIESTSQSVIAVSPDEKIALANGRVEQMFGYHPEELIGQRLDTLIPESARERHTDHHKAFFANMQTRPMGIGFTLEGRRKDGTRFPVEIGLSFIETDASKLGVAFVTDITESRRLNAELRRREREVMAVLENSPDAIMRIDMGKRYTYVNATTAKVAGIPAEEMVGKTYRDVGLPESLCGMWDRVVQEIADSRAPQVIHFTYPSPAGETFWEERIVPEFGADGSVTSMLAIARDITQRVQLERVRRTHTQEVQALAARLLTVEEEERRRVSRELHDQICQQLAALAMDIGGLAAKPGPPKDVSVRLKALQARAAKASEEARHIAYELHPSILDDLGLVAALRDLCRQFSERNPDVALTFEGAPLPPIPVEIASCLYRVAQESLTNILKHAGAKRVFIGLAPGQGTVGLTIEDDGAGFEQQAVKGRGGLGLISMEERARLVNGNLSIAAQPGAGTRIALNIPLGLAAYETDSGVTR